MTLQFLSVAHRSKIFLILALISLIGLLSVFEAPVSSANTSAAFLSSTNAIEPGVSLGDQHSCVLSNDGLVKCWGNNLFGQLGLGTTGTLENEALDVIGLTEPIAAITAGWSHTCALTTLGNVYCWGRNAHGQLGDGSTTNRLSPVKVKVIQGNAIAVDAGSQHTCAILEGGGLMCWGANSSSQLGVTPQVDRLQPELVTIIGPHVADVSAGAGFTCVVTDVGGVKCWGNNFEGQLGNGTAKQSSPYGTPTPQDVGGLDSGVESVSAGGLHACAFLTGGSVRCWGRNDENQLGDGTTVSRATPVEVTGLSSGMETVFRRYFAHLRSRHFWRSFMLGCELLGASGRRHVPDVSRGPQRFQIYAASSDRPF